MPTAPPEPHIRPARAADAGAVRGLLTEAGLPVHADPAGVWVAAVDGAVVACARLRPIGGGHELAGVAVRADLRGTGIGSRLVERVLAEAEGPVHALAVAPGFFLRLGFVASDGLPPGLAVRADGECRSTPFVALVRPAAGHRSDHGAEARASLPPRPPPNP